MTRRILLSTIHASDNYGSVLQASCLVDVLGEFGDVSVLDYRPVRVNVGYAQDWLPYQVLRRRINPQFLDFGRKHRRLVAARRELPLTDRVWRPRPDHFQGYDAVVVGSDEVWSGLWGNVPSYFLADVPATARRVAYAVSVGRSEAIGRSDQVPEWLRAFDAIHPRDARTADLCRQTGVEPGAVVCDPVVLVDPDRLRARGREVARVRRPYTALYFERCDRDARIDAILAATESPRALLSVGFPYPDATPAIDADLDEFVGTIAGAELVITSMFHGVVTGLTLGKPVAVLEHPAKSQKVRDFLDRVQAKELLAGDGFTVVAPTGDLEQFREASRAALRSAMG